MPTLLPAQQFVGLVFCSAVISHPTNGLGHVYICTAFSRRTQCGALSCALQKSLAGACERPVPIWEQ